MKRFVIFLVGAILCPLVAWSHDEIHLNGKRDWEDSWLIFLLAPVTRDVVISDIAGGFRFEIDNELNIAKPTIRLPRFSDGKSPKVFIRGRRVDVKTWSDGLDSGDVWVFSDNDQQSLLLYVTGEDKSVSASLVRSLESELREETRKRFDRNFMELLRIRCINWYTDGESRPLASKMEPHLLDACGRIFSRLRAAGRDPFAAVLDPSLVGPDITEPDGSSSVQRISSNARFADMVATLVKDIDAREAAKLVE